MKRELRELARRAGILDRYVAATGELRMTSDQQRISLLAAMGFDTGSAASIRRAVESLEAQEQERLLEPVKVIRAGRGAALEIRPGVLPAGSEAEYHMQIESDRGENWSLEGKVKLHRRIGASIRLSPCARSGYYTVALELKTPSGWKRESQLVLVVPRGGCTPFRQLLAGRKVFGLTVNLYTVSSERNWGAGDLSDLVEIAEWAKELGAAFVGLNPLHATRNRGHAISPYSPVSRLLRNAIYLDVTAIPEWLESAEARSLASSEDHLRLLKAARSGGRVDYEAVMRLKEPILRLLHRRFLERHGGNATRRGREYREFRRRWDPHLTLAATFLALEKHLGEKRGEDWRSWPLEFRSPDSPAVREFARTHAGEIDFYRYLQFELDRQLRRAAQKAPLPVGILGDLAIGSDPAGADSWIFRDLFVKDASIGAPPDAFISEGQDWGLAPIHPSRLLERRLDFWIALVRFSLAHCGALRIDHVMGLFRQYWIPRGSTPARGAYVRYPAEALLAVLAIESRRRQALIIGEDLGTVPRGFPALLARWGILSTRVLYFERDAAGRFRSPRKYSRRALVSANTHDQIPLAGFWEGRDLEIRRSLGLKFPQEPLESRRKNLVRALIRERCASSEAGLGSPGELCRAVNCFLSRTPAPMVGISLDDLAREKDPVNLPGVSQDRYPSWTRRLGATVAQLRSDPAVKLALQPLERRKWPK
ncbi:4-alpha-glucanotransferase [bacterium HR33]|nr:4-alpha-glucanotransferase [bacterium HR33]